jgi:hypothetical protein
MSAATASRSSSRTTNIPHVLLDIAGRLLSRSGTEAIMGLVTPGGRGFPSKSILGNSGYRAGVPSGAPAFSEVYGLWGSGYNTGRRNCTFEWEVKTDGQRGLT